MGSVIRLFFSFLELIRKFSLSFFFIEVLCLKLV